MLRRGLEHVKQRGDEGVDAAAEVLQVDEQDVERSHRLAGRPADLAVQAEDRNAERRVGIVRRLDHIVLLVAAQPVLGPEGRREPEIVAGGKRVERMGQVRRHRGGMGEQGDPPAA
jgi:hypothetical protein